jgi:hypothetical protein
MRAAFVVLALLVPSLAHALDVPPRRPGLWQMTMTFEDNGLPQQVIKQCIDAETDKLMNSLGGNMRKESCAAPDVQHVGDTIVVNSTCKFGGSTNVSHAVVTGDFNSAYTVKVDSRRSGPPVPGMPPGGDMKMTIGAKWLGPCTAGQKPGDMIMGNGMTINIRNMPSMGGGMPRH